MIGDFCWHCHALVQSFTLQMAVAYDIPLIVYGESSADYGLQGASHNNIVKFDKDYFTKLSAKLTPKEFACDYISMKDLKPAELPSAEECKNLQGIHLGNYIYWDCEKQVEEMKKLYNWKGREVSGSYKDYKSIECSFEPMHEFTCLEKRGFARSSIQASGDIRDEKMTREQAFELIDKYERIIPKHFNYFLDRIGMTHVEFRDAIQNLRPDIMKKIDIEVGIEWREVEQDGIPFIERFLKEMRKK